MQRQVGRDCVPTAAYFTFCSSFSGLPFLCPGWKHLIEGIIQEEPDEHLFCQNITTVLTEQLNQLKQLPVETLLATRQARFRQF